MSENVRLIRVAKGLSARERVLLLQQALLAREEPPLSIRMTTPDAQRREFNRYAALATGVFRVLLPHAIQLQHDAERAHPYATLLVVLAAWGSDRAALTSLLNPSQRVSTPGPSAPWDVLPALVPDFSTLSEPVTRSLFDVWMLEAATELKVALPLLAGRLQALKQVAAEVVAEFESEAVVPPQVWAALDHVELVVHRTEDLELYLGPVESAGRDDAYADELRAALRRLVEEYV